MAETLGGRIGRGSRGCRIRRCGKISTLILLTIFIAAIFIATILVATTLFAAVFPALVDVAVAVIGIVGAKVETREGLGRGDGGWLTGWSAEIRQNGLLLDLALAQGGEIVGYGFFFVEADLAGVGADKSFIEDAAGELVEVFVFEGAQHAGADFRGVGDGVELKPALLALFAKFFSEGAHLHLLLSFCRHRERNAIIIGEGARRTPHLAELGRYLGYERNPKA